MSMPLMMEEDEETEEKEEVNALFEVKEHKEAQIVEHEIDPVLERHLSSLVDAVLQDCRVVHPPSTGNTGRVDRGDYAATFISLNDYQLAQAIVTWFRHFDFNLPYYPQEEMEGNGTFDLRRLGLDLNILSDPNLRSMSRYSHPPVRGFDLLCNLALRSPLVSANSPRNQRRLICGVVKRWLTEAVDWHRWFNDDFRDLPVRGLDGRRPRGRFTRHGDRRLDPEDAEDLKPPLTPTESVAVMRYLADEWWGNHMAWVHCHEVRAKGMNPEVVPEVRPSPEGRTLGKEVGAALKGADGWYTLDKMLANSTLWCPEKLNWSQEAENTATKLGAQWWLHPQTYSNGGNPIAQDWNPINTTYSTFLNYKGPPKEVRASLELPNAEPLLYADAIDRVMAKRKQLKGLEAKKEAQKKELEKLRRTTGPLHQARERTEDWQSNQSFKDKPWEKLPGQQKDASFESFYWIGSEFTYTDGVRVNRRQFHLRHANANEAADGNGLQVDRSAWE